MNLLSREPNKQPLIKRADKCNFCSSDEGHLLSQVDYWDIAFGNLVKCPRCGLAQLDPMPTDEMMDLGCTAFYRMQHTGDNPRAIQRGFLRSFRKGVAFGVKLKLMGIRPFHVLEIGAGDGYFSRGLQFVFPRAQITCLDLVEDLLHHVARQHGFRTIKGSPETIEEGGIGPFDLIIARDIIEHLADPGLALKKLASITKHGGYLHFITPNGVEDYWGHFTHWKLRQKPTELLLNHVNYFEPVSLHKKLQEIGFEPVEWFNYDFKGTRQGYGRVVSHRFSANPSIKRSARQTITESQQLNQSFARITSQTVLKSLLWLPRILILAYCYLKHNPFIKLHADHGIGHEIFCIAKRK